MEKETISWHGDTPEKSGFLFFGHDQVISFPEQMGLDEHLRVRLISEAIHANRTSRKNCL